MSNYFGETRCQATLKNQRDRCKNNAYYAVGDSLYCGIHSKGATDRTELPKNPNARADAQTRLDDMFEHVKLAAQQNRAAHRPGSVVVTKFKMMKKPVFIDGYLNVYPNYKHQNRVDGYGAARLSPKSLGPVEHGMPGLPPARNIENYHQFAKFWPFELDNDGNVLPECHAMRVRAYNSPVPHRHKYDRDTLRRHSATGNINVPECSIYYDYSGRPRRYSYLQCRYFYCHYYERLAKLESDFATLWKKRHEEGVNLNIVGYDGYHVETTGEQTDVIRVLWECYNNTDVPFGHELVLYTLLTVECRDDFPWNVFYRNNVDIYYGVIGNDA